MKVLILNTDYLDFLSRLYSQHPGLDGQTYSQQMQVRHESLFGVADFYSRNLRELGHEAHDIYANNEWMQAAWAREQGMRVGDPPRIDRERGSMLERVWTTAVQAPTRFVNQCLARVLGFPSWSQRHFYEILAAQIKHHRPEVVLNQAIEGISSQFMKEMKPYVRLMVGQHAATLLSDGEDFSGYDMMISSFPPTVEYFRGKGIHAELSRLGFEPGVLSKLECRQKSFDVTFVGNFFNVHTTRIALLETLCERLPQVKIWASAIDHLPPRSTIRDHYMGQAWGRQMYEILRCSKITLNHHGDVAPYANNMRLYEATGVGTLLITDAKGNLREIFEPGKEVIAYHDPNECVQSIQFYLEHEGEREAIARAGQERTLREHTYYQRMQELVDIVKKCL
jgi:spore maturation protein CgeB